MPHETAFGLLEFLTSKKKKDIGPKKKKRKKHQKKKPPHRCQIANAIAGRSTEGEGGQSKVCCEANTTLIQALWGKSKRIRGREEGKKKKTSPTPTASERAGRPGDCAQRKAAQASGESARGRLRCRAGELGGARPSQGRAAPPPPPPSPPPSPRGPRPARDRGPGGEGTRRGRDCAAAAPARDSPR